MQCISLSELCRERHWCFYFRSFCLQVDAKLSRGQDDSTLSDRSDTRTTTRLSWQPLLDSDCHLQLAILFHSVFFSEHGGKANAPVHGGTLCEAHHHYAVELGEIAAISSFSYRVSVHKNRCERWSFWCPWCSADHDFWCTHADRVKTKSHDTTRTFFLLWKRSRMVS